MAKPAEIPRWAVTTSDVLATNTTAPSSGQMDTGWTPSQIGVSSYDNRFKAFAGLWAKWLDGQTTSDGRWKQPTKTLQIAPTAFVTNTASPTYSQSSLSANGLSAFASVTLPTGKVISEIRVFIQDNTVGPTKQQLTFSSANEAGSATTIAASSVSAGSHAVQTLTVTGLSTTVTAGTTYSIVVLVTTGTNTVSVFGAEVDYSETV